MILCSFCWLLTKMPSPYPFYLMLYLSFFFLLQWYYYSSDCLLDRWISLWDIQRCNEEVDIMTPSVSRHYLSSDMVDPIAALLNLHLVYRQDICREITSRDLVHPLVRKRTARCGLHSTCHPLHVGARPWILLRFRGHAERHICNTDPLELVPRNPIEPCCDRYILRHHIPAINQENYLST